MNKILFFALLTAIILVSGISTAPEAAAQSSIYLPLVGNGEAGSANAPTATATQQPTTEPTSESTRRPTRTRTRTPTVAPTDQATTEPPATPTPQPTNQPTSQPTETPTPRPTADGSWWQPSPDQPIHWHWQLSQTYQHPRDTNALSPNVTVFDIDGEYTSAETVRALKDWGAARGKTVIVICYIDVGVYEDYRSDAWKFEQAHAIKPLYGNPDEGWEGSWWLDIRQLDVLLPIMEARIRDWCHAKGFDAVEPDESEVWSNDPGFPITLQQNVAYSRAIADIVHSYGLSVGLKGNNAEAALYEPFSDWSLTEQCFEYDECDSLVNAFVRKGKAVFSIEYDVSPNCAWANANHINAARRDLNLMGPTHSQYRYSPCVPDDQDHW